MPKDVQPATMDDILNSLTRLNRSMDESLHLQRMALLGPELITEFSFDGEPVRLALPDAQRDYIQRTVLKFRSFYETRQLMALRDMRIIGPNVTVADIGANIGNHSVFFGHILKAKKVISFEPQAHCFDVLQQNLDLNGMKKSHAKRMLLGEAKGKGRVAVFKPGNLGGTEFEVSQDGDVPVSTLKDALNATDLANLGFIKIDVEGMQMPVLRGAAEVIEVRKPPMWIELLGDQAAETIEYLSQWGYSHTKLSPTDYLFQID